MTDHNAEVDRERRQAICRSCDRSWTGSAVEEVGEAHAAKYDHRVEIIDTVIFNGPEESDD